MIILRIIVFPIALLYGSIILIRNLLFNLRILPSKKYNIPIISVGNLSYGGTGKTPHVEYLIRLLQKKYNIATLSRGYKRKSTGFVIADINDSVNDVGDEALQYKRKFNNVVVAVDKSRRKGIKKLLKTHPEIDVILMDDAFQHRFVSPGLSILLSDYHNLFTKDFLIPSGTLREHRRNYRRADIIIVTKSGSLLSPIISRSLEEEIKPRQNQSLYFSFVKYDKIVPFTEKSKKTGKIKTTYSTIILIAGIANSYPLEYHLKNMCNDLIILKYRDHYQYTLKDVEMFHETYNSVFNKNKIIITTEKDAMRMVDSPVSENIKDLPIYYIPILTEIHKPGNIDLEKQILNYVKINKN